MARKETQQSNQYLQVFLRCLKDKLGERPHVGTLRNFASLLDINEAECAYLIESLCREKHMHVRIYLAGVPHDVASPGTIQLVKNPILEITCI